ncbi:MAG: glucose-6-phosphate isomerase [Sulfuricurvum sp. PC08-66]|nr:MAG: glucose-6-phosphate isomerase [Sulfuricurvum sp. PC08-66]
MLSFDRNFAFESSAAQHTIMENAFAVLQEEHKSGKIGYYELPTASRALLDAIDPALLDDTAITDIAVVGIGGSSLGLKAIDSLLCGAREHTRKLHFFENSDPRTITATMARLTREKTYFIIISKSGSTIETTSIFKTLIAHFDLKLDGADRHRVMTITDSGSSLDKFAAHYGLASFHIPLNVGGRFSILSAVGVVPLALAGYNVASILAGAQAFLERFWARGEEHLLEKACYFYEKSRAYSINVLFSYADSLDNLTKWYVQLWGESLGKIDPFESHVGLTPIGIIGSVDQHSFLQLLIEGPRDKTVTFIQVEDFNNALTVPNITLPHIEKTDFINGKSFTTLINAQCDATRQSLIQTGLSVDTIRWDSISESNIGATLIYFELLTSLVGAMLMVNTYDQPGVELGKTILNKTFQA